MSKLNHVVFVVAIVLVLSNIGRIPCMNFEEGERHLHHEDLLEQQWDTGNSKMTRHVQYLDLPPSATEIVINIGTNMNPILPRYSSGPCAMTIAFEPIVPEQIPVHPQVMVVPAAVSDNTPSLSTMYVYNKEGRSSSLNKPAEAAFWNTGGRDKGIKIVPVVSIQDVLLSIPPNTTIDFLQTDAQGQDFLIIQAAMPLLLKRKVRLLRTEAYMDRIRTYEGVENDLCLHWLPLMSANGYALVGVTAVQRGDHEYQPARKVLQMCEEDAAATASSHTSSLSKNFTAGLREVDAMWILQSSDSGDNVDETRFEYPVLKSGDQENDVAPSFTKKEYETCRERRRNV